MDIEWSAADLAFRDEVRQFLRDNLTAEIRAAGSLMTSVYGDHEASMQWQRILHRRGWAAPAWPREYGGCAWSVAQRYIFSRECSAAGAPPVSPMGIQMCGPALIEFGTEDQKAFFLPRMLSGEHFWCQGYSEPGSGSDLSSLSMSAIDDGDDFICNGTKIWTTHASCANWIFCLVRTAREARQQQGITFLLIDMTTPGIEVTPIVGLTGEHIQNQIFFSDVRVPKRNVVGTIGAGWTVAKYLLEFERGGVAYAPGLQNSLASIRRFAERTPGETKATLIEEPLFAARLAAISIRVAALETFELQAMSSATPGIAASIMKICGTELQQLVAELGLEACGHYGHAFQPQAARPGGPLHYPHADSGHVGPIDAVTWPLRYLNERAGSIYGGSNEIQRNILARTALGL
jgi:alkylation response protein AidB-like acyl-CoA dehydrogenase